MTEIRHCLVLEVGLRHRKSEYKTKLSGARGGWNRSLTGCWWREGPLWVLVSWMTHGQGRSAEICIAEELPCKWANHIAVARACQPRPWADANQTLVPWIQPRPPQPSSILQISKQEDTWISRAISTSPAVSIHCDWQVPRWSYLLIVRMANGEGGTWSRSWELLESRIWIAVCKKLQ